MKKVLVLLGVIALLLLAGWGYWVSLGDARQWLLFNKNIAEKYAATLLKGNVTATQPDELIDTQISTYPGWVLFSPHDDVNSLILAYSPNKVPEPFASDGTTRQWRQVKKNWYELD